MIKIHALFLSTCLLTGLLHAEDPFSTQQTQENTIVVHNRILAKVMDKTISVIDVMKKMDVFLNRYYPKEAENTAAKFQFYNTQWRHTLEQMIDNELILADATEKEVKVTDGEVREELQNRFGPNVMGNLDKIGITYDEARKMIHSDLIVQKMTWFKIHSKALQNVNSQDVKLAYEEYRAKNPPSEKWKYQVLSVKAPKEFNPEMIAKRVYQSLLNEKRDLSDLVASLKEKEALDPAVVITVSQEYEMGGADLASTHKTILQSLQDGSYSTPIAQKTRTENEEVFKIFHRKEHRKSEAPPFLKVANTIKDELIQMEVNKQSNLYMARLRERYGYDQKYWQDLIPSNFQPFTMH